MNETPAPNDSAAARAALELARLRSQAAQARDVLRKLQHDIAEAESRLGSTRAAWLVEANEELVLALLRARGDAETAATALSAASRSADLDALTQLPNRVLLLDRLNHGIAHAKRHGSRLALLFVDLDRFKEINDTLGHAAGDQVLKLAALRLASSVRGEDTVSRYGGDEFVILLTDVSEPAAAARIAKKVLAALAAPSRVGDSVLRLAASIGIAIYPDDGLDADVLIDRADAAMYRAKRHRAGFVFCGDRAEAACGTAAEAVASPPGVATPWDPTIAEHERRYGDLREANARLVSAALGAQELQAAAEKVQLRQTELLALVAHELRNPLNPLRTAAALLGRVGPLDRPRLQAIIERQVQRVARLASDLLDVSRVTTGKLRLEMQLLDVASVIDESVETCRPAMDLRAQRLQIDFPDRALRINGDATRLAQVFGNLLDNASKYTPNGGEITLSARAVDDSLVVTVSDNGIGMTAQGASHVFDPFVQEPHAIDFNGVGLGLGLTVVRELVQAHGGRVVGTSDGAGLGSRFVVALPLAETEGAPLE